MFNKHPKISVIIPVYNVEAYLEKCLDSILSQSFQNYEVILIDDGSSDKSGIICDYYSTIDSRIIVIHKENEGPVVARLVAAEIAKGEYIVCIDSDDSVEKDYFKNIDDNIQKYNPEIICYNFVTNKGILHKNQIESGIYSSVDIDSEFLIDTNKMFPNRGCLLYSLWTKVVKREIFLSSISNVPKNLMYGEDIYQILLMVKASRKIQIIDNEYYIYRTDNAESIMNKFNRKSINKYLELLTAIESIVDSDKLYSFAQLLYYDIIYKIVNSSTNFKDFKKYMKYDELIKIRDLASKSKNNKVTLKFRIRLILDSIPLNIVNYGLLKFFSN